MATLIPPHCSVSHFMCAQLPMWRAYFPATPKTVKPPSLSNVHPDPMRYVTVCLMRFLKFVGIYMWFSNARNTFDERPKPKYKIRKYISSFGGCIYTVFSSQSGSYLDFFPCQHIVLYVISWDQFFNSISVFLCTYEYEWEPHFIFWA